MANSYTKQTIHIVFSTKNRRPLIEDRFRETLHASLAGISKHSGAVPMIFNSVEDHVHGLVILGKNISLADYARNIKGGSSTYLQDMYPELRGTFSWQTGYGAFAVSTSAINAVTKYILNQQEHHKKFSFEDEYRLLLTKNSITWDEKYLLG